MVLNGILYELSILYLVFCILYKVWQLLLEFSVHVTAVSITPLSKLDLNSTYLVKTKFCGQQRVLQNGVGISFYFENVAYCTQSTW
jgi:hypothetical protein